MPTQQERDVLLEIREKYGKYIKQAAKDTGLHPNAIAAVIYRESRGDQYAIGGSGEWGLTQIMPATAMSIADSLGFSDHGGDPEKLKKLLLDRPGLNILFGASYYKRQLDNANGDYSLAYSMYNGGPSYRKKNPSAWDRIKSGDYGGTDPFSENVRGFNHALSLTGYDIESRGWGGQQGPQSPAEFIRSGGAGAISAQTQMNPSMMPQVPEFGVGPFRRTATGSPISQQTDIVANPYTQQEAAQRANTLLSGLRSNPVTALPTGALEGFGDALTNTAVGVYGLATGSPQQREINWTDIDSAEPQGAAKYSYTGGRSAGGALGMLASGVRGIGGLAAYGAAQPGSMQQRLGTGAAYGGFGLASKAAPNVTTGLLGRVSPAAAENFARAVNKPLVRAAHDVPMLTGMEMAQGVPFGEALASGAGMAAGLAAAHPTTVEPLRINRAGWRGLPEADPSMRVDVPRETPRLSRTPAEMEMSPPRPRGMQEGAEPARVRTIGGGELTNTVELRDLAASRSQPIPGNKTSETLNRNRAENGRHDIDGVISDLREGNYEGYQTPEQRKIVGKEAYKSLARRGVLKGKRPAEVDNLVKKETDRLILRETLDPDFVNALESQADFMRGVDGDKAVAKEMGLGEYRGWPTERGRGPSPGLVIPESTMKMQPYVSALRFWQGRGGGEAGYGNVMDKAITRTAQEIDEFALDILDQLAEQKIAWAQKHGVKMDSADARRITEDLQVGDLSTAAAAELADIYEQHYQRMEAMNEALGGKPFGKRENYAGPHFEARPGTMNIPARVKGSVLNPFKEYRQALDDLRPARTAEGSLPSEGQWTNPRRLARRGRTENPEMDPLRRLEQFNQNLAFDIAHNLGIKSFEAKARFAEATHPKFEPLAEAIRNFSNDRYKNEPYGPFKQTRAVRRLPVVSTIMDGLSWQRRRLMESVFPGNLLWTMTVQPSSSVQSFLNTGMKNSLNATRLMANPEFRYLVDNYVYSAGIKGRGKGSMMRRQGEDGSMLTGSDPTMRSPREQIIDQLSEPGTKMEKWLGYYSAASHFLFGKQLGLKGRELLGFVSDGIAKDQSMYDRYNRSPLLKAEEFNNVMPFKGFLVEIGENIVENAVPEAEHGQYRRREQLNRERAARGESAKSRSRFTAERLAALGSMVVVANMINEQIKGRGVFSMSTIPGYDELTGSGVAGGLTMPAAQYQRYQNGRSRARRGVLENNPSLIAQGMAQSFSGLVGGGAQLKRIIDTWAATEGAYPFLLEDKSEIAHSLFVGPSGTMQGREYWQRRDEGEPGAPPKNLEKVILEKFMRDLRDDNQERR